MKTMKTILAAAIGIALATAAVNAVGATQDDEDSVYSWGPWAKMVSPAAGPQGVGFLDLAGLYEYRPDVGVENGPCAPGAPCGFATYKLTGRHHHGGGQGQFSIYGGEGGGSYSWNHYVAALFNLDATPGKTCAGYCGLWVQINDATFQVVPITLGKYGELYPTVSSVSMNGFYFEPHWGLPIFMASGHADHQHSEISGVYFPMLELAIGSDQSRFLMDGWSDKTCGRCGPKGGEGAFIYGVTPTLSALQSNIGGITAHYQGGTIYGGQIVHINVTLNSGVWDGSWSNGFAPTAFAFDANGTISGVNLTSTNLSGENVKGNPTTYTGSVNGAFFGTNAQTVGGVADVTRTVSFEGEGSDTTRHVDLFVTTNLLPPVEK